MKHNIPDEIQIARICAYYEPTAVIEYALTDTVYPRYAICKATDDIDTMDIAHALEETMSALIGLGFIEPCTDAGDIKAYAVMGAMPTVELEPDSEDSLELDATYSLPESIAVAHIIDADNALLHEFANPALIRYVQNELVAD